MPAVGYTPPPPPHPTSPPLVSTPGRFPSRATTVFLIQQQVDEAMGPLSNPDTRSKTSPTRRRGC